MKSLSWAGLVSGTALGATAMAALGRRESPGDACLEEKVRNELLDLASFPSAIDVHVHEGTVELSGSVLPRDHVRVVQGVLAIGGVRTVRDGLYVAETAHHHRRGLLVGPADWPSRRARTRASMATALLVIGSVAGIAAVLARGALGALLAGLGAALATGALVTRRAREPQIVLDEPKPEPLPLPDQVGYGMLR